MLDPSTLQSTTGGVLGTQGYIDPDVLNNGTKFTTASDVYSFGVVIFQLLTAQPTISNNLNPAYLAARYLKYFGNIFDRLRRLKSNEFTHEMADLEAGL